MAPQQPSAASQVRTMQIIAVALCVGVIAFGVVAAVIAGPAPAERPLISWMAAGAAFLILPAYLIVPSQVARVVRQQMPSPTAGASQEDLRRRFYEAYQTKLIVGLALLEGAAFFNLVAYILDARWWSLAIVGGLLFLMLGAFPTASRVESWVEYQIQSLEMERIPRDE